MHGRRIVVPAAVHVEVLVHSEPTKVERLVVDQEPGPFDSHGPDPDGQRVAVDQVVSVHQVGAELVEVRPPGLPKVGCRHPQLALAPGRGGHQRPIGVVERHSDGRVSRFGDDGRVADDAGPRLDVR